mmetsp:Transcript_24378/g.30652  ORF Transcript_24378/g.30652 Transcript_24378/m.30652 type:complete len:563 (+) Transcript_24378:25-1713(+)
MSNCCQILTQAFGGAPVGQYTGSRTRAGDEDEDVVRFYESRPERSGMWFIAHKALAEEIIKESDEIVEVVDVWDEFFSMHPVGVEYCKNFVVLMLSEEYIKQHREKIRVASYRWEDIKGIGKDGSQYCAPSNYVWFLQWLENNSVMGWMDFFANIVPNVSGKTTVAYMGRLYMSYKTVSHWMLDPLRLGPALGRGWIFQETAFGAFDSSAISKVLDQMREWALASLASKSTHSKKVRVEYCLKFCEHSEHLSKLLDRRGYYAEAQGTPFLSERQYDYYRYLSDYGMHDNVAELVVNRVMGEDGDASTYDELYDKVSDHVLKGYSNGYTAMYHLCDLFTDTDDEKFSVAYETIHRLLTEKSWTKASTAEDFFEKIGDPLFAAYSSLEVSYQSDRNDAVTQVAKTIVEADYGQRMNHEAFCRAVWVGAANICLQTPGTIGTTVLMFNKDIPDGNRFIGGVSVSGAFLDGSGGYKLKNGSYHICYWSVSCVTAYNIPFVWYEENRCWKIGSNEYHVFLCKPPKGNNFFCGYVAMPAEGGPPTHAQFFTSQSMIEFPEPAEERTFS